jgi:hypothetical protein
MCIALHVYRRISSFELPGGIRTDASGKAATPDTKTLLTLAVEALCHQIERDWLGLLPFAGCEAFPLKRPGSLVEGADSAKEVKLRPVRGNLLLRVIESHIALGCAITGFCVQLNGIGKDSAFPIFDVNRPLKSKIIFGWAPFQIISLDIERRRRLGRLYAGRPDKYAKQVDIDNSGTYSASSMWTRHRESYHN